MVSSKKREELVGALHSDDPAAALRHLESQGALFSIIPELQTAKGAEQPPEHFWDVLNHLEESVSSVDAVLADPILLSSKFPLSSYFREKPCGSLSRLTILKIAALFHDIAKPQTLTREPDGQYRFFGHPELGASIAKEAMLRLGFFACEISMVSTMIVHHLRPGVLAYKEVPSDRALLRYFRDLNDVAVDTLILSLADHRSMRGPLMGKEEWIEHLEAVKSVLDRQVERLNRQKMQLNF